MKHKNTFNDNRVNHPVLSQRLVSPAVLMATLLTGVLATSYSHSVVADDLTNPFYVSAGFGHGVGSINEESETTLSLGGGYQFNEYVDFQVGVNQVGDSIADDSGMAAFADARVKYALSPAHDLYGLGGLRSAGDLLQAGVGVLYHHNDTWTFDFGYRYYATPNNDLQGDVYAFMVGLEYHFSVSAPVPVSVPVMPEPVPVTKPEPVAKPVVAPAVVVVPDPKPVVVTQPLMTQITINHAAFDANSIILGKVTKGALDTLALQLLQHPQAQVDISGHTDSVGPLAFNKILSEKRAQTVASYLIEKGIDKDRISVQGYGETKPVADNATHQGRGKNRRVEIYVPSFVVDVAQ